MQERAVMGVIVRKSSPDHKVIKECCTCVCVCVFVCLWVWVCVCVLYLPHSPFLTNTHTPSRPICCERTPPSSGVHCIRTVQSHAGVN